MNKNTYYLMATSVVLAGLIAVGVITCQSEKTPEPPKAVVPAPPKVTKPEPPKTVKPAPDTEVKPAPEQKDEPAPQKIVKPTRKKKVEPSPQKKEEPAPTEPVETKPRRSALVFAVKVEDKPAAKVTVTPKEEGDKTVAIIKTTPTEGHYLNAEYPWSLTIEPSEGLVVDKKKYSRSDLKEKTKESFVFKIPFQAPPETKVKATLKMGVCDKKAGTCSIKKIPLTW